MPLRATSLAAPSRHLGWLGVVRLGLVQTALGAIVVLTTSTLNRVMVVELALPAMLPGLLVALHYALQITRPRWGHASDVGGRRTPWIIGGMAVLAAGGTLAAMATALMATWFAAGLALAIVAFTLIGLGVGAAGTSLLVLLAKRVEPGRRAAAATIVWVMMIFGFIVTAGVAGHHLDPFTTARLVAVTTTVSVLAFLLALVAVWGVEGREAEIAMPATAGMAHHSTRQMAFRDALAEVWSDAIARRFTIFVALSMFAYSAQDLILEPYAGAIFGFTPGQSTKLAGVQHSGVLSGMVLVALLSTGWRGWRVGTLAGWTIAGCLGSALALVAIAAGGMSPESWPLSGCVFALGLANGAFAVAAIGSMMALAGQGRSGREGIRMGLWGAAQAIAFGAGGAVGAGAADLVRLLTSSALKGYTSVFLIEAVLFVCAALLAARIGNVAAVPGDGPAMIRLGAIGENMLEETGEGAR